MNHIECFHKNMPNNVEGPIKVNDNKNNNELIYVLIKVIEDFINYEHTNPKEKIDLNEFSKMFSNDLMLIDDSVSNNNDSIDGHLKNKLFILKNNISSFIDDKLVNNHYSSIIKTLSTNFEIGRGKCDYCLASNNKMLIFPCEKNHKMCYKCFFDFFSKHKISANSTNVNNYDYTIVCLNCDHE